MPYYNKSELTSKEMILGLTLRSVWIDKLMITMVDLEPGCVVPKHSHPHEQITYIVKGSMEMMSPLQNTKLDLTGMILPDSPYLAKFANTAIPDLVEELEKLGAEKRFLKAKIMGGAHMFGFAKTNKVFNIGARNVEKVKEVLKTLKLRLVAEDVGGSYGRSLYFYLETGDVRVRTIAHGEKIL